MSFKKSALTSSSLAQLKHKGFKLVSCLSSAKQLFKCNSLKQHRRNADYEYIGYGNCSTNVEAQEKEPMSSTAIFTTEYKNTNNLKDISVITRIDESSTSVENIEKTRNQQLSTIHSISNALSPHKLVCDDETIIASTNDSSFSNIFLMNTSVQSNRSINEMVYLQSTQITPLNEFSQFSQENQIINNSPVSSTFIEQYSNINAYQQSLNNVISKLKITKSKYICVDDYEATFFDDVSVISGEFVEIVNSSNEDWLLVRVIDDQNQIKQGYVPRNIVCEIDVYIGYLKEKINLIKMNSKSSLVSLPVTI